MGLQQVRGRDYYERGEFHGSYQFTRLADIISQFMIVYVGEDKIIPKAKRTDVAFHAQRAMQELSFDTFKSARAQEITVPPSLTMTLPIDYVNYTKISWIDNAGTKHLLYPESKSSNPKNFYQNEDGDYIVDPVGTLTLGSEIVELDGDYSDILVHGMRVTGLNLPNDCTIHLVTTLAGITSITLKNIPGTIPRLATATTNQKLRIFRYIGLGNHRLLDDAFSVATTISVGSPAPSGPATTYEINVTSTTGIKKGMYINHPAFINDNNVRDSRDRLTSIKVIGVGTSTVELSHLPVTNIVAGEAVSFVSYEDESDTWENFKSVSSSENKDNYHDDTTWASKGGRYGLDPQSANINGSFYVDDALGEIHFSSNLNGRTVVVDYLSDSLATDGEHKVHKFAEEAMYKCIVYAMISTRANIQEYIVRRYRKERFAAIRNAKLRLSNIKLEEITQIFRGKSKQIKH